VPPLATAPEPEFVITQSGVQAESALEPVAEVPAKGHAVGTSGVVTWSGFDVVVVKYLFACTTVHTRPEASELELWAAKLAAVAM
jgi:fumarate hydratase class II